MNKARKPIAIVALLVFAALALTGTSASMQGKDSLNAILKDLQTYDFASGVGAPMALHTYVFAHKDDPQARKETEAALLKFIQGSPAPGGLMAACRSLSLIGGPDSARLLAELVLKPEATDPARYALERIPGNEAGQALLAALDRAHGEILRGVVFSVGERKSAAAVSALAHLAGGKDSALAADAIKALGKIGGGEAIKLLADSLMKSAALRSEAASALLLAAETALQAGDRAAAATAYDKIFAANVPPALWQAAFKGKLAAASDAQTAILKALTGKDIQLYAPALAMVPASFGTGEIGRVAELMSRLPESAKVQLTGLLAAYPSETVRPYLLAAAESPSAGVRLTALRSIAQAGDAKSVVFLATKAARTTGAEQETAREALARLRGLDVDTAVFEHLARSRDDAVKAELVRAASERRIAMAKPLLMDLLKSGSPGIKTRAAAALRTLCLQADVPGLLDLLGGLEDEAAREAMQDTIASAARTNPRELARAGEVKDRLAAEKDPHKRADLLRVLGKIGDDSALSIVRAALADPDLVIVDSAVRALAEWPTIAARDDVLGLAGSSPELNHRVLSLRAYVRMIGLEPNRSPEGAAADLLKALALSPRPEEKKLILGLLGRFPCVTSLKTAESLLADPAVAYEAKLAVDSIRRALE